jgi:hypothetical protein
VVFLLFFKNNMKMVREERMPMREKEKREKET